MPNLLHLTFAVPTRRELAASGQSFSVCVEGFLEYRTRPIFWQEKLEGWHMAILDPQEWAVGSACVMALLDVLDMTPLLEGRSIVSYE